jgi:hypothetical protein
MKQLVFLTLLILCILQTGCKSDYNAKAPLSHTFKSGTYTLTGVEGKRIHGPDR